MLRSHRFLILLIVVLTSIPSIAALLLKPEGFEWTGLLSRNTGDTNVYLSQIEEVRGHSILTRNLFTAEPHSGFQLRPIYAIAGLAGRFLPFVKTLVLMEIFRILATLFCLLMISACVRQLWTEEWKRNMALWIVATAAGFGWTGVEGAPDVFAPESSAFLSFISPPHFAVSLGLLFLIAWILMRVSFRKTARSYELPILFFAGLWLALEHPFDLLPLSTASLLWLVIRVARKSFTRAEFLALLLLGAGAAIGAALQWFLLMQVDVFREWHRQSYMPSAATFAFVISLGALIPLAIAGISEMKAKIPDAYLFLIFYVCSAIAYSRMPFLYQWRFLEGAPSFLALFAAAGLFYLNTRFPQLFRKPLLVLIAAVLSLSSVAAVTRDIAALKKKADPQYLPVSMMDALRQVSIVAPPDAPVLASYPTGNFIAGIAARPVVAGHRIQTVNLDEKYHITVAVFSGAVRDENQLHELIAKSRAQFLFWGPAEKNMSHGRFHPEKHDYLTRVFSNPAAAIYKIER